MLDDRINNLNESIAREEFASGKRAQNENDFADELAHGAGVGLSNELSKAAIHSAYVREGYKKEVADLNRYSNSGRDDLKRKYRTKTLPEVRALIPNKFGPNKGSVGRANITNPKVNKAVRLGGVGGAALLPLTAYLTYQDIINAKNKERAMFANGFSTTGGLVGGFGGAMLGSAAGMLFPPAAIYSVPGAAIGGSALGGSIGYEFGEYIYDKYYND